MEAVPCGAKEKGLTGLGTVWASAGITHVDSDEKLCPQYMVITDDMEYHIRPTDTKHPELLPIGKEIEFKIKKDEMYLRVVDGWMIRNGNLPRGFHEIDNRQRGRAEHAR